MIDIINQIISENDELKLEKEDKLLVAKINKDFSEESLICGLLQYGSDRDPKLRVNWDNTSDKRDINTNEIVLRNYYFLLKLPTNEDEGCLILQRKGSSSVQKIFMRYLRKYIRLYPNHMGAFPEISDKVPKETEKYFKDGIAISLDYIYKDITDDSFDDWGIKKKRCVVRILLGEDESPSTVSSKIKKKLPFFEDDPIGVKIESNYNGSKKMFDLDDEGNVKPYVELTENLSNDDYNGNSLRFEAIDREAKKMMKNNFSNIWDEDMVE